MKSVIKKRDRHCSQFAKDAFKFMNLIVGLGNPGEKYEFTRHNIGFMVVDKVLKDIANVEKTWVLHKDLNTYLFKNGDLIFAKPQAFMNNSGVVVKRIVNLYKVPVEQIWVIHDDIDLPIGKIRIRRGGSSGGHNGVESIIKNLPSPEFLRFRLGIGRGKMDIKKSTDINLSRQGIEKFVLAPFKDSEAGDAKKMIKNAVKAAILTLDEGLEKAMNRFN